jgi:hypothetical protein
MSRRNGGTVQQTKRPSKVIIDEVASWPGVTTAPGRFGSVRFLVGRRELGHIHGDWLVDIPFPRGIRDKLVAEGTVVPHRPLPDSGWASRHIESEDDVKAVIELLRFQYDRATAKRSPT